MKILPQGEIRRRGSAPRRFVAVLGLTAILSILGALPTIGRAQDLTCAISGEPVMDKNITLYAAADGTDAIARFTGASTKMVAFQFPAEGSGRIRVKTGTGRGGFKLNGYVDATELPLFTAQRTAVYEDHVWLAPAAQVVYQKLAGARLQVKKDLQYPFKQSFTAWGDCNAFSLTQGPRTPWSPPDGARAVAIEKDSVVLYDNPRKEQQPVLTVQRAPYGAGVVAWRTQRGGAFSQVEYHGEVIFSAWARNGDLKWLPQGETQDEYFPPQQKSRSRIRVAGKPKVITTGEHEAFIFLSPNPKTPSVGVIEPNTETYVVDVVGQWASVLPKTLNIAPSGDAQFWVKMKELGITKKDIVDSQPPKE